jgi:hypothetical protein
MMMPNQTPEHLTWTSAVGSPKVVGIYRAGVPTRLALFVDPYTL